MTSFTGVYTESLYLGGEKTYNHPLPPSDEGIESIYVGENYVGTKTDVLPERTQRTSSGNEIDSITGFLDDNFWLIPESIDAGMITEDLNYEIYLWNSGKAPVTITSVLGINTDGTQLIYPALPLIFGSGAYQEHTLTVFASGSPMQRTSYQYVDGTYNKTLTITGMRVVFFSYEPTGEITLKIAFSSIVYRTKKMYEQRRSLGTRPKLTEEIQILLSELEAQKFRNAIRYLHKNVIACPFYADILSLSADVAVDDNTVLVNETIQNYWCMNTGNPHPVEYILLMDRNDIWKSELKRISSFGATSITFQEVVNNEYSKDSTSVYPCFLGILASCSLDNVNNNALQANVTLEEIFLGGI